jgi:hypothetical protein
MCSRTRAGVGFVGGGVSAFGATATDSGAAVGTTAGFDEDFRERIFSAAFF